MGEAVATIALLQPPQLHRLLPPRLWATCRSTRSSSCNLNKRRLHCPRLLRRAWACILCRPTIRSSTSSIRSISGATIRSCSRCSRHPVVAAASDRAEWCLLLRLPRIRLLLELVSVRLVLSSTMQRWLRPKRRSQRCKRRCSVTACRCLHPRLNQAMAAIHCLLRLACRILTLTARTLSSLRRSSRRQACIDRCRQA